MGGIAVQNNINSLIADCMTDIKALSKINTDGEIKQDSEGEGATAKNTSKFFHYRRVKSSVL